MRHLAFVCSCNHLGVTCTMYKIIIQNPLYVFIKKIKKAIFLCMRFVKNSIVLAKKLVPIIRQEALMIVKLTRIKIARLRPAAIAINTLMH